MNLGQLVCTHKNPSCNICPIYDNCQAFLTNNITQYTTKQITQKNITKTLWWLLLWFQPHKKIWLIKRSEKIWKGLFCFPEFYDINTLNIWLNQHNLHKNQHYAMHLLNHKISNINLKIHPILLKTKKLINFNEKNGIWYNLDTPETIGLPKPVSTILNNFHVNQ